MEIDLSALDVLKALTHERFDYDKSRFVRALTQEGEELADLILAQLNLQLTTKTSINSEGDKP